MSRILHHVGKNDFKKTRQRQIGEQKERAAKELKERREAEIERKIIEEAVKPFKSDWRLDFLIEAMTTAGLGMINLDGSEEVLSNELSSYDSSDAKVSSLGDVVVLGKSQGQPFTYNINSANHTQQRAAVFKFDSTRLDTLVVNMSGIGGGQQNWCDPSCIYDNSVKYAIFKTGDFSSIIDGTLSNGDNTLSLPSSLRVSDLEVHIYQYANDGAYSDGYNPPSYINSINVKRRTPINVLVPLDDPEANSFIRGGLGGSEERRAKLKDMLESGNEWMTMLGLEPSKTSPGDIEISEAGPGVRYQKFSDAPGSNRKRGQAAPPVADEKWDPHMQMMVPYIPKA